MPKISLTLSSDDFNYHLPAQLIAHEPLAHRDQSRLLVLSARTDQLSDEHFNRIGAWLEAGDLLIINNSKVFPARLFAHKQSGAGVEVLAERLLADQYARVQIRSNRAPQPGSRLYLNDEVIIEVVDREGEFFIIRFVADISALNIFQRYGHVPLPPYIQRACRDEDTARYQTVYAEHIGAVAAPTAGLHFTQALLAKLSDQGVGIAKITLHVGAGTFKPVKAERPEDHKMHAEYADVSKQVCEQITQTRANGKKVVAVGTSCVRALESAAMSGRLQAFSGDTEIFIYPGYTFKVIDALITNFHLPKSTLLMLVSAFAGHDKIMRAYQHAISRNYRFYSYGDAMLILP